MKFNYQARSETGEIKSGMLEASNEEAAFEALKSHGLYVTFLEKRSIPIYARRLKIFERVSRKDIVVFSRQLAIMFKSKVPLVEAFQTIAKQAKNRSFKEIILKIMEKVEGGTSLSKALATYPKLFSPFYVSMVRSGEASGKLIQVFNYLADYLEKENYFREKIRGAMIYPAFILFVFVSVIAIIITFVIPQLAEFLNEAEQELPWITKVVMSTSEFLRVYGWIVVLAFISLAVGIWRLIKTEKGKTIFDSLILKPPLFGSFFKKYYLSRFALNLSTLVSGGLPIAQALKITADVVGNDVYREIIAKTGEEVKKGEKISVTLESYPHLISPIFFQMIVVGEKTGSMDATLLNVVDFYQKDIDRATDNFVKMIEPLLIIVLGLLIGGLAMAVLMPIYSFGI